MDDQPIPPTVDEVRNDLSLQGEGSTQCPWIESNDVYFGTSLDDYLAEHAPFSKITSTAKFFPSGVLQSLLAPKVVEEKLLKACEERRISRDNLVSDVRKIIGGDPDANITRSSQKSWLKIFALLVLVKREADIFFWIDSESGICDSHLPLVFVPRSKSIYLDRSLAKPLPHFDGWRLHSLRVFDSLQWQVKIPVFTSSLADPVPHHNFDVRDILPFLAVEDNEGVQFPDTLGGYGRVECVRLPSSCYNFQTLYKSGKVPDTKGLFALKKLEHLGGSSTKLDEMFSREREMLKRFGDQHEHIIRLLATFTYQGDRYFLFPWANCDLLHFWENTTPRQDHETALWIAEQCLQLVNALHEIHYLRANTADLKKFGRHGDIKSENVLMFPPPLGTPGHGKLVLADLGFSSVHREISISAVSGSKVQSTLQYRPPELAIQGARVTRSFDIWTLGCLFLDMCTWWLGGWDLVKEFQEERFERGKPPDGDYTTEKKSDVYFEVRRYRITPVEDVKVKGSVKLWFQRLRELENCSQYILDFLGLIETKMIIVEARDGNMRGPAADNKASPKRIRTQDLKPELERLLDKCADRSYASRS